MSKSGEPASLVATEPGLASRHVFRPLSASAGRQGWRLILRRAALAAVGSAIAVLPLFALRAALLIAAVGLTQLDAGWVSYLPLEFVVPFLAALLVLRRRPAMATAAFAARVLAAAVIAAPLFVAFVMSQEFFRHFADGSALDQVWMAILGTVPALGALGFFGMLVAGFPLLLLAFATTAGLDAVFCRRHRVELADLEQAMQVAAQMRAGFYDVPGLPPAERAAMSRDFADLRGELLQAAASDRASADSAALARQLLKQLYEVLAAYASTARVLTQKLSPTELTYQRYLGSAKQVYASVLQHLRAAATSATMDEARRLVGSGDEGIRALRATADAVARLKTERGREAIDLASAVRDLEELARRVDRLS